jgi:hypothetical protein
MINKLKTQRVKILIVAIIFGAIGTYLLIGSRAATPFASLDADKGTLAGRASIQNSTGATNGTYVRFDASTGSSTSIIPSNFKLIKKATKVSDWDAVLIEQYKGTITDTPKGMRYWVPGPAHLPGGRVETQLQKSIADQIPSNGGEAIYQWKFMIPSSVVLPPEDEDGFFTMSQQHGNNQAGYTGGTGITLSNEFLQRVSGGKRLNPNTNEYEYRKDFPIDKIARDRFYTYTFHVRWDESQLDQNPKGFFVAYLDGVKKAEAYNIPTMGPQADNVMMRVGWYPKWVGPSGLDMYVQDYEVWVPS